MSFAGASNYTFDQKISVNDGVNYVDLADGTYAINVTSGNTNLAGDLFVGGNGTSTMAGNLDVAGNIEGSNVYTGDLFFANGWKITEAESLGRDYSGLVIFNKDGKEIAEITDAGFINYDLEKRIKELEKQIKNNQSFWDWIKSFVN